MARRDNPDRLLHATVIDGATLFLCRQGRRWVIVIESPHVSGALPFEYAGRDAHDARFELLTVARRACPDATIMCTDGALTSEDFEWSVEVRGIVGQPGDLGRALHGALSAGTADDEALPRRHVIGSRCHWGLSPALSGRPRSF